MTKDKTVTMSRELEILEEINAAANRQACFEVQRLTDELRSLLATPVVERQPVCKACNGSRWVDNLRPVGTPAAECLACASPPELAELQATIARLTAEIEDWKQGSKAEADAGDEARAEVASLKAEIERLKGGQGEPVACATCNGSKIVDDGELTHSSGGIPYENGPIKCVKDCPDCASPPAPVDQLQALKDAYEWGYSDGQNNPNGYSSKDERDHCAARIMEGGSHGD
jgi:uncharacterized small protein (DUF1192 family)